MLTHVALFRNLNLGQGVSPTRGALIGAFAAAGAVEALSFQGNGTVAFDPGRLEPRAVADAAVRALDTGYADVAPALALADLPAWEGDELSAFTRIPFPEPLPWTSPRGEAVVVAVGASERSSWALSVAADPRRARATPVLERLLGVPVTSRGVGTMERLRLRLAR